MDVAPEYRYSLASVMMRRSQYAHSFPSSQPTVSSTTLEPVSARDEELGELGYLQLNS
jgi:hypothetical protein